MTLTLTVIAAFHGITQRRFADAEASALGSLHVAEVAGIAKWAADWFAHNQPGLETLGFTAAPSWGGGAGWDTEAGVTFVFANVDASAVARVRAFAVALRLREVQDCVAVLTREETFALV